MGHGATGNWDLHYWRRASSVTTSLVRPFGLYVETNQSLDYPANDLALVLRLRLSAEMNTKTWTSVRNIGSAILR